MLRYKLQKILTLLLPALILGLASIPLHSYLAALPYAFSQLISYLPLVLGTLALVLCIIFNQGRLLLSCCNLLGIYLIIQQHLQSSLSIPANYVSFSLISLIFPVQQLIISFLPERGLNLNWLWSRLPWILSPYLLIWALGFGNSLNNLFTYLPMGLLELAFDPYLISSWSAVLFILGLVMGSLILWFRSTPADSALLVVTLTSGLMLMLFNLAQISTLLLSLSLSLILFTVLFNSYSMAFIDELTGLPGRRALENTLTSSGRHYTLAMVDVDHFKKFNDTYGHDVGDQVLRMVASQMKKAAKGASVYRYGGEEFTLVFRGIDEEQALPLADHIRETIANYPMRIRDKDRPSDEKQGRQNRRKAKPKADTVQVCISIGLCQKTADHKDSQAVIKQADEALYLAKQQGRNRCVASHIAQPRRRKATAAA